MTDKQQAIVTQSRIIMPPMFSANVTDEKILAYADLVLGDINLFPPLTGLTTETIGNDALPILYMGIQLFTEMFMQMNATLQDFDYNDNGLAVRVDQTSKIDISYKNLLEIYRNMIKNFKKNQVFAVGGKGLGTPRYQSQIGQFLKIALGSAFNWNS